jgi:hypothetical protein
MIMAEVPFACEIRHGQGKTRNDAEAHPVARPVWRIRGER